MFFSYSIGEDPADWVTVDKVTGKVTTSKAVDRESPYVKDNIYNVTIYAVDNGMTRSYIYIDSVYSMLSITIFCITQNVQHVFLVTRQTSNDKYCNPDHPHY